ncbi:MAG: hypothetical protein GY866_32245 [Proteobacteria bacterium]|nr:hypothetical protein [Pseudomonadota bacterium]
MNVRNFITAWMVLILSVGTLYGNTDSTTGSRMDAGGVKSGNSGSVSPNRNSEAETDDECVCTRKYAFTHKARRTERPFQMQVLMTGGSPFPDEVGLGAGLHLGYQFSELLYLGLTTHTPNREKSVGDPEYYDNETILGQEGVKKTEADLKPRHLLEMRFTPWDFGLYFSAGLMYSGGEKYDIQFKNRPRIVNETEYTTGMDVTLEYEDWMGLAAGIGFNYIFENGFSLGVGFEIGLDQQTPEVTVKSDVAINAADLEDWIGQIEENEKRSPHMFYFGLGYAF